MVDRLSAVRASLEAVLFFTVHMSSLHIKTILLITAAAGIVAFSLSANAESCSSLRNKYNQMVGKTEQYTSMGNIVLAKRFLDQAEYYVSEMKRSGCK